ncbi:hypothetical protein KI387_026994, partial [Taxus chinensis]
IATDNIDQSMVKDEVDEVKDEEKEVLDTRGDHLETNNEQKLDDIPGDCISNQIEVKPELKNERDE